MDSWQIRIVGVAFVLLLAGCATSVSKNVTVSAANVAKYKQLTDVQVVATLDASVSEARAANMPFLAPNYYREAAQVLSECQSTLGNKSKEVLTANAAKGEAILEKGRTVMAIVQYRFAKALELKQQLDALNTAKLLPREYEKVIGGLTALIDKVEREQPVDTGKDADALLAAMQALEIQAVQESALRVSDLINADSKKKNADKQAPLTYAESLRVYQSAKEQIAAAPHDDKLVQRLGAQALFAARHAQQVNERVGQLQTHFKATATSGATSGSAIGGAMNAQADGKATAEETVTLETLVLQEEDRLLTISAALGIKDLRDRVLEKQVAAIQQAAAEMARRPGNEALQDLEARLKAANQASEQAQAQLAAKELQLAEKTAQLEAMQNPPARPQTTAIPDATPAAPTQAAPPVTLPAEATTTVSPPAAPAEIPLAALATNPVLPKP